MPTITLGQRILELAKIRGWSQAELARRLAIEKSHLSRLLKGERSWQPEQIERVAKTLEVSLPDLVKETDAEGLPAANQNAHEANRLLTAQLAEQAAANEALRAALCAVESERDAARTERDTAKSELERAREELRRRPTVEEHDGLRSERDKAAAHVLQLHRQLGEVRQHVTGLQLQLAHLQGALKKTQGDVLTNYQAYMHWRQQAESTGKTLTGVAIAAAGLGLVSLLKGSGDDGDDDDGNDDDDFDA